MSFNRSSKRCPKTCRRLCDADSRARMLVMCRGVSVHMAVRKSIESNVIACGVASIDRERGGLPRISCSLSLSSHATFRHRAYSSQACVCSTRAGQPTYSNGGLPATAPAAASARPLERGESAARRRAIDVFGSRGGRQRCTSLWQPDERQSGDECFLERHQASAVRTDDELHFVRRHLCVRRDRHERRWRRRRSLE